MKRYFGVLLVAILLGSAGGFAAPDGPCKTPLSACPKRGCADPNTAAAFLNTQKRRVTPIGPLVRLTFADFRSLQEKAEELFEGHYHNLSKPQRLRLRSLQINGQTVGEGSPVEITGFITVRPSHSKPHANSSGESVNCRLTTAANNDFHISIVPSENTSEWQGIVVEMVPQKRPSEWTETRLQAVQAARKRVRVQGLLFFDNHHTVNGDEANNISNQPKRFSLWEIHPVTRFEVCTVTACQPDGAGWKPLEELP